ncbi:hypothetical protein [Streptacidiphilus melanogenes]|uniref:hypothetical protein n=1 Tax=Streptacidiphilus melanogenes TaxID=411235 RepID=UPI0005A5F54A|nr:hypothetical protein [Streptacidiphilus melanogenes]
MTEAPDQSHRLSLEVLAGGDALRQEQLTVDLQGELRKADGWEIEFREGFAPDSDGRKGIGSGDLSLWAACAAAARPAANVLVTLIKEWCAKERHRKVEITLGDDSVVITGKPDPAHERVIDSMLAKMRSAQTPSEGDGEE